MKTSSLLLGLFFVSPALLPVRAAAQDYSDLDGSDSGKKSIQDRARNEQVREINRGLYLKASVGGAFYLGKFSGAVSPGTATALAVGQDFIDRERTSMAWEIDFFQGIHQGMDYNAQIDKGPYIEGDLRTYTVAGLVEWNTYPARRWGVGLRGGGGVLYSPLLMNADYYGTGQTPPSTKTVLDAWGVSDPGYHNAPHPLVMGGPNVEYYTKLAHFSVGMDIDVFYAIGFDLGTSVTGNMKYTF
ncbi:MAG: adventurous gliding motility protein CglE [Oligoflexia bacterium]|nr:adventurous gliding motility protein CglE [Oligoflexia bacterium]